MQEHYFLASDGGGTKVDTILFDADLRLCGSGSSGGVNTNFIPVSLAEERYLSSIEQAFGTLPRHPIQRLSFTIPKGYDELIAAAHATYDIRETAHLGENEVFLLSGVLARHGLIALSGTGSGLQYRSPEGHGRSVGGGGSTVDDEGSGYWIGREAFIAAIKDLDDRGPATLLSYHIMQHANVTTGPALIADLYRRVDQRGYLASLTVLVLEAARNRDRLALKILQEAGVRMAEQLIALRRRGITETNIVLAGSVWRDNPWMRQSFLDRLHTVDPAFRIFSPIFKPIVGAVIKQAFAQDMPEDELWDLLIQDYSAYLLMDPAAGRQVLADYRAATENQEATRALSR